MPVGSWLGRGRERELEVHVVSLAGLSQCLASTRLERPGGAFAEEAKINGVGLRSLIVHTLQPQLPRLRMAVWALSFMWPAISSQVEDGSLGSLIHVACHIFPG